MKHFKINLLTEKVKAAMKISPVLLFLPMAFVHAEEENISNTEDEQAIEVIVISNGYSTFNETDVTGAIATVELEDIIDLPAGNVMQNLQGRIPGLQITTNGNPNSGATVRVRGQGLGPLGNNDPLYIIDGIPTKSGLHEINSNDIENIQVLKDAAAASIYGARSGNGVIVVTTKRGRSEELEVNFRFNQTYQDYSFDLNPLNTKQRGQAVWQAAVNDGTNPNTASPLYTYDWNEDFSNPVLNSVVLPAFTDPEKVQQSADTNWFDEVTRSAKVTDFNLSIASRGEQSNFNTSFGYYDAEGIVDGSNFERLSFRINSDHQLIEDTLKVGQSLLITNQTSNIVNDFSGNILGLSIEQQSIVPVYNDVGGWGGPVAGVTDRDNPVRLIEMNKDNESTYNKVMANFYVEYTPIEDLTLRSSVGIDYGQFKFRNYTRAFEAGSLSFPDELSDANNWNRSVTLATTAEYKLILAEKHNFTFLAGIEQIHFETENSTGFGGGFASDSRDFTHLSQATTGVRVEGGGDEWKLDSQFARVDYNYDDRYLLAGTIRRDGSSKFGSANEYGTFPALSAGWVISNEAFFDVDFISRLKVRGSWGETGNQEIASTATTTTYEPRYATQSLYTDLQDEGTAYDIAGNNGGTLPSGFVRAQSGNEDLKWETSTQTNIGIDIDLFDDTLYATFDWFDKETKDILTLTNPIATLGEGAQKWVNGGTIENTGIEFIIGYADGFTFDSLDDDIFFDISFNISSAKNKVTALPEDVINSFGGNGQDKTILGHSINSVYGYVADGLFQSQEEVDAHATQAGAGLGRIRWTDLNGDGVIDADDQDFFTDGDPDFNYGFNVSLFYKQWDFNMFWQGVNGGEIKNSWRMFTDFTSLNVGSNYGDRVLYAWSEDNTNSDVPALTLVDNNGEGRQSSFFYEDASYLKLRNLSIGYTPEDDFLEQFGIVNARFYLQGSNLLTITPNGTLSQDPETPNEVFPVPRSIRIGVDLTF
ncbi:MAG: SusC/RagA family TonB-linked outer membrane protein [Colwellia sp.]